MQVEPAVCLILTTETNLMMNAKSLSELKSREAEQQTN